MSEGSCLVPRAVAVTRPRWTILIVSAGGALETFDFVIYGFFAQDIGRAFFPVTSHASATALSFAVFAIGHLSRPLGGMLFGHLGDRHGRRGVFAASAMIAAVATLAIGLLPDYASWGVAAPTLLLALRLVQGVCVGGEISGSVVYAVESTRRHRGLLCGGVFFAVNVALLFAASINLYVQSVLGAEQIATYGWRAGFLIGGATGLVSFILRRRLAETKAFAQSVHARPGKPLAEVFHHHLKSLVVAIAATTVVGAANGLFVAYAPAFLRSLGYARVQIATAQIVYVIVIAFCMLGTAALSDEVPRRYVFRTGTVLSALFAPWFFITVTGTHSNLFAAFALAAVVTSFANGTCACVMAELFPIEVRYAGVGIALNVSLAATMGGAPLFATLLVSATHRAAAPALVQISCAAIAFAASFAMLPHRDGHAAR